MDFLQGMLSLPVVDPRKFLIDDNTPVVLGCFMIASFPWHAHVYYKARGYVSRIVRHLGIEHAQVEPLSPHEHAIVARWDAETENAISELAAKIETVAEYLVGRICARALCPSDYVFIPACFDALAPHPRGHPLFLVDLLTIHLRPTPRVRILLKEMRQNGFACASPDGRSEEAWDHILRNAGGVRQLAGRDFYSVVAPPVGRVAESCSDGLLCYNIERDVHTDEGMMHFAMRPAEIQMYDRLDL